MSRFSSQRQQHPPKCYTAPSLTLCSGGGMYNNGGAAHSFALLLCGDEIFPRSLQSTGFEYYSAPVEIEVKNVIQTDCHVCNFSNWEGVCVLYSVDDLKGCYSSKFWNEFSN
jgi:hypothetical protein